MKQTFEISLETYGGKTVEVRIEWNASSRELQGWVDNHEYDNPESLLHVLREIGGKSAEILETL